MAKETYKNVRKNRFTQVGNSMLWDKELTLEGKGMLSIFLSNSEDWKLNMKEIIKRSKNGRDKHYTVINELIEHGYFARIEIRKGGKFEEMIYIFSDDKQDVLEEIEQYKHIEGAIINPNNKRKSPLTENPDTVETSPFTENPDTVKADTKEPDTESQNINNTSLKNTNLNNTNEDNTKKSISQSISQLYDEKSMPIPILQVISKNLDRLIEDNIHPITIKVFYDVYTEHKLADLDFAFVLEKVLSKTKGKIENFHAVMKKAAANFFNEYD